MGADFLLIAIDVTGWSDGDATSELILRAREAEVPDSDADGWDSDADYRDALVQIIEDGVLDGSRRDTTIIEAGGRTLIAAGGNSWGDSPSEAFDELATLSASGIFDVPPPWAADSPCVIAYGNPFDGITLEGPFGDPEDASNHANATGGDAEWHIIDLDQRKVDYG